MEVGNRKYSDSCEIMIIANYYYEIIRELWGRTMIIIIILFVLDTLDHS